MTKPRYLTKSRFKLAVDCPTKLFYTGKEDEYTNQNIDDPFLLALAEGGFQIGELAKAYYPDGVDIKALGYDEALAATNELLATGDATIFEAAVRFENLFIRVDILRLSGNRIEVIEVKSKSYDKEADAFFGKRGGISSAWKAYLYDIAFQKYVVQQAFPGHEVAAFLMMTDKAAVCPTDGLNQKIRIVREGDRKSAKLVEPLSEAELDTKLLCLVPVDEECDRIFANEDTKPADSLSFAERVSLFAASYERDEKIPSPIGQKCKDCEFIATPEDEAEGLKSGFKECWRSQIGWSDADFEQPTVLDIWDYRQKDKMIAAGKIKLAAITEDDIGSKADDRPGLSRTDRQWLQVSRAVSGDGSFYIDADNLAREMESWKFPLHFIDFETATPAIPFNRGRRPYEGIAFQFSHHVVEADGTIRHAGEYINTDRGAFPNYAFARALKAELETDSGTIFRYAAHENSYLNMIYRQLREDTSDIPDREELCEFIRSITVSGKDSAEVWEGERKMVDQLELVKRYFYDPYMGGSNSIKKVLPAILNASEFLQAKYSMPIYGDDDHIPSRNFERWAWIAHEEGIVIDPYQRLPRMFADIPEDDLELLSESDMLNEGGAAMTAYARLQFEDMTEYERSEIIRALLKYCELDTFAMVMIYEGWREMLRA